MKLYKRFRQYIKLAVLTLLLSIGVSSCYYDYGLSTSDYDAILTHWDNKTDFGTYKTFVLVDSVFHLIGKNDDDDISREYDKMLLDAVSNNFGAKGYSRVKLDTSDFPNNLPDFVVTVSIGKSTYTGGGWYYPPYWGPGWGWYPGYPGYWPGGGYYYSYETGTVFVDFIDTEDIDFDNPDSYVKPKWSGIMEGLISSTQSNAQRILNGINRMFYQSTVLVAGKGDK